MVQSVNYSAIFSSLKGLLRPHLYMPACSAPDIRWIDFGALRAAGYRAICFDKDNTLTLPYAERLYEPLQAALDNCLCHFSTNNILVISNSAGSGDDRDGALARSLEAALGLPVLRHQWKKPALGKEIMQHFRTLSPAQIVFVGDRLATDIFMANNLGMLSVHTQPLTVEGDNQAASRVREVEAWALRRFPRPYSRPDLQERFIRREPLLVMGTNK